jgi:DUF4097 and DUF4098 domain-containing protein YvlB
MNRRIEILILILILFSALGNLAAKTDAKIQKEITYKVENNAKLVIDNISGWIKIESWDKNDISIEYTIHAYGDNDSEAKENLQKIKVLSNKSGNQVEVKVKYEKDGGFLGISSRSVQGYVNFNIKVPKDCRIDAVNVSGDTQIQGIAAEISSSTVSGENIVKNVKGKLKISAVSGNLVLTGHKGRIEANCVSGDMEFSDIESELKTESVSGDVILTNAKLSGFNAETVSGDIIFSGEFLDKSEISLETVSGDIVLKIQNEIGLEYSLSSFSGDLMINLPNGKNIIKSKKLSGSFDSKGKQKVSVDASTLSGDIKIEIR